MKVPSPEESGYTIYSKSSCKYCNLAKKILPHAVFFQCDKWLEKDREEFIKQMDKLTKNEHRTFPMIFKDGIFIGGYNEISKLTLTDFDF
jgi:glutaredoxin